MPSLPSGSFRLYSIFTVIVFTTGSLPLGGLFYLGVKFIPKVYDAPSMPTVILTFVFLLLPLAYWLAIADLIIERITFTETGLIHRTIFRKHFIPFDSIASTAIVDLPRIGKSLALYDAKGRRLLFLPKSMRHFAQLASWFESWMAGPDFNRMTWVPDCR